MQGKTELLLTMDPKLLVMKVSDKRTVTLFLHNTDMPEHGKSLHYGLMVIKRNAPDTPEREKRGSNTNPI